MIVTYGDTVYQIKFVKEMYQTTYHGKKRLLIHSLCVIKVDGDDLGEGRANQNVRDRYSKVTGKKIALQRAIDDCPALSTEFAHAPDSKCREIRTAIWKKFYETFGRWN